MSLKKIRNFLGLSLDKMAWKLGINYKTLGQYESNQDKYANPTVIEKANELLEEFVMDTPKKSPWHKAHIDYLIEDGENYKPTPKLIKESHRRK